MVSKKRKREVSKMAEEKKENKEEMKEKAPDTKGEATVAEDKAQTPQVELSQTAKTVLESVENMTVLELSNLVKALEEKFGVTAAAPAMAAGMMMAGAQAGAPQAEEKATCSVVLASVGGNKIQVIKEIRTVTTLGLKEAKDLVDSAPKTVKEDIPKEEGEEIKKKLEAAGAKVELK